MKPSPEPGNPVLDNAIADFKELLANDRWAKGPYAEMARHSVTNLESGFQDVQR